MDIEIYLWMFLVTLFLCLVCVRIFYGTDPEENVFRRKDLECDTCGQISNLTNGLCDYCIRFYKAYK